MAPPLRIVVTGLIAQHPTLGGMTWHYLQYLLGLARFGYDVYYIEDSGQWPYNLDGGAAGDDWIAYDCSQNVAYLKTTLARFGFENKWAYRFPIEPQWFGLSNRERADVLASADLLINVSGSLEHPEEYRQVPRLIYIDTDPVFTQVRLEREQDFRKRVAAHDLHFTFGECLSKTLPMTNYYWRATRQPVVLSEWRTSTPRRDVYTTVMNWTSYKPLAHAGKTYHQKDAEFYRFLELPSKVAPIVLEVALSRTEHMNWRTEDASLPPSVLKLVQQKTAWTARELLMHTGWCVVDAIEVCCNLDGYRNYIQSSKAEWSVAKHGYISGQPGWFSDRSACYLAAGRPVIVQDTGFTSLLRVGEGILTFRDVEEAIVAIREVEADYGRHTKAARDIAEEYFDSDKVLSALIEEAISCVDP